MGKKSKRRALGDKTNRNLQKAPTATTKEAVGADTAPISDFIDSLEIRPSNICDAGNGLFCTRLIKTGLYKTDDYGLWEALAEMKGMANSCCLPKWREILLDSFDLDELPCDEETLSDLQKKFEDQGETKALLRDKWEEHAMRDTDAPGRFTTEVTVGRAAGKVVVQETVTVHRDIYPGEEILRCYDPHEWIGLYYWCMKRLLPKLEEKENNPEKYYDVDSGFEAIVLFLDMNTLTPDKNYYHYDPRLEFILVHQQERKHKDLVQLTSHGARFLKICLEFLAECFAVGDHVCPFLEQTFVNDQERFAQRFEREGRATLKSFY